MNNTWKSGAGLLARLLLGGLLLATALDKLSKPLAEFAALIDAYQLTPPEMNHWLAGVFAATQLVLGLALLLGYLTRMTAAAAFALFGAYFTALLSVVLRHIPLADCGCYGEWIHLAPWQSAALDVVFMALAVLIFRRGAEILSLDNWITEAPR